MGGGFCRGPPEGTGEKGGKRGRLALFRFGPDFFVRRVFSGGGGGSFYHPGPGGDPSKQKGAEEKKKKNKKTKKKKNKKKKIKKRKKKKGTGGPPGEKGGGGWVFATGPGYGGGGAREPPGAGCFFYGGFRGGAPGGKINWDPRGKINRMTGGGDGIGRGAQVFFFRGGATGKKKRATNRGAKGKGKGNLGS